ncbi:hypothetical protein GSI_02613 [Ganoderma sinense ZZ0214-1]|uniref:F-box domain-containing protein n=1 Tax=Ganoderma sinense ZZ0214-1 TaxID=1077348 RepID=A0A2G8SM17_9APHY|nr:hypothetical protein GSI_02613 [Ganoderma sinense ZZ0214-1]
MDPRAYSTDDVDFWLNGAVRATTNLRDENLRLAAENDRLEKLLSKVIPELNMLREERLALKGAVRVLMFQSGTLPASQDKKPVTFITLPEEVLQPIFAFAAAELEPTDQFDPFIFSSGAHHPWLRLLRTKKGFPLICRATFWPGTTALYSEIALRRMGQVVALADTLRSADIGPRLGTLIKSVRWDSCVAAAPCADTIREELAFILGQCTRLQSFSYHPHHQFPLRCQTPDRDECEGFFNPLRFFTTSSSLSDPLLVQVIAVSSLRSLDISVDLQKVDFDNHADVEPMLMGIHRILSALKGLESLTLGLWSSNSPIPEALMTMPSISLPSLTDLQIFAPPREDVDAYLCSRWDAPQLARLTIHMNTEWAGSPTRLLQQLGSRLRYLHFYPVNLYPRVLQHISTLASTLATACPLLEHLIVPSTTLVLNSPMLAHLDLWTSMGSYDLKVRQDKARADTYREWVVDAVQSSVPALRTVRFLFMDPLLASLGYISAGINPDWPRVCHPALLGDEDDVLYHRFPLGHVVQTVAAIIPESYWQMRVGKDEEDEVAAEELRQRGTDEDEESEWESDEREGGGGEHGEEETSSSDWTSDDCQEEGGVVIEECVEAAVGPLGHMGLSAGRGQSQELGRNGMEEGDGRLGCRQLEAAAELALRVEYPVEQLDRATILVAFQRCTTQAAYNNGDL